jgi:hypothetical protein
MLLEFSLVMRFDYAQREELRPPEGRQDGVSVVEGRFQAKVLLILKAEQL